MQHVEGRVAFITGGASGIGLGLAKVMVKAGMKVVIADIRQDHLEHAQAWFTARGLASSVRAFPLDVTDREAFANAAEESIKSFGKVHVLVNNAGMGILGPLKLAKYDDWDWGLGVLLGGVINGIQTFLPLILSHGEGGHIVNTSSMAAVVPIPDASIYITAKAALLGLSESIRAELQPDGIGVSVFCPGPVQTNIRESGRTRPARYRRNTGFAQIEERLEQRPNDPLWMDPLECGERILRGIRRNDLYIFTHREFKEGAAERFAAMLASFPDEPLHEERAAAIRFLLSNPVFAEQLRRARGGQA